MKKVKLEVEEKLTYRRDIIVEIPDGMDESGLERALNRAERGEFLDDFLHTLEGIVPRSPHRRP